MNDWLNLAQRQADEIKRRRNTVSDLRLVAELIEDGLPRPICITPLTDGVEVHVFSTDAADWLVRLGRESAQWSPTASGKGERLDVSANYLGTPIRLVGWRGLASEVTC